MLFLSVHDVESNIDILNEAASQQLRLTTGRRSMPPPCRDRGFIQGCDPPHPPTTCPRHAGRDPTTNSRCRAKELHTDPACNPAADDLERTGTPRHGQGRALTSARPGGRFGPFTEIGLHKETRRMAGQSQGTKMPAVLARRLSPSRNAASPAFGLRRHRSTLSPDGRGFRRGPCPRPTTRTQT